MNRNTLKTGGFSLIEILVALVLLTLGLLGLSALQASAMKVSFDSGQRSQATWVVGELVERMRANVDGQASGYTAAAANADLCENGPAKMCADHYDGENEADATADCSANELAEFDIWELTCGFEFANTTTAGIDQIKLAGNGLTLACDDSDLGDSDPCTAGSQFTATLNWTSTSALAARTGEEAAKSMTFEVMP